MVQGYIADVTPAEQRAGRMALLGAAYNVGFIFGPAVGGLLAQPGAGPAGFRLPLLTASALRGLLGTCIFLVVKESRVAQPPRRRASPAAGPCSARPSRHPVVEPADAADPVAGLAFNGIEATFGFWAQHRYRLGAARRRPLLRGRRRASRPSPRPS